MNVNAHKFSNLTTGGLLLIYAVLMFLLGFIYGVTRERQNATRAGVGEYFIDTNQSKAFRWKP